MDVSVVEVLTQVMGFVGNFGVGALGLYLFLVADRKYNVLHDQYISDLRELAGFKTVLQRSLSSSNGGSTGNVAAPAPAPTVAIRTSDGGGK